MANREDYEKRIYQRVCDLNGEISDILDEIYDMVDDLICDFVEDALDGPADMRSRLIDIRDSIRR